MPQTLYIAIRAYQQVKNMSMVYSLQQIKVGSNRILVTLVAYCTPYLFPYWNLAY